MDRQNISSTGDAGSIDSLLERSKDNVDFEFSIFGLDVHFYFFLGIGLGMITVDSATFEKFTFSIGSWSTIIPEALVTFVNSGIFTYVGDDLSENDVEDKILMENGDLLINLYPTASMDLRRPLHGLASKDGHVPVIIKNHSMDEIGKKMEWFTRDELIAIVKMIHGRKTRS